MIRLVRVHVVRKSEWSGWSAWMICFQKIYGFHVFAQAIAHPCRGQHHFEDLAFHGWTWQTVKIPGDGVVNVFFFQFAIVVDGMVFF